MPRKRTSTTPIPPKVSTGARVARLSGLLPADHPRVVDARREHVAAAIAAYVQRAVAEAPPLRPAQVERLRRIIEQIPSEPAPDADSSSSPAA